MTSEASLQAALPSYLPAHRPRWLKRMGATEEQGELISAIPDWAALQSCLFIQSSRPLRKWLCLFPSVSCEPWAKYTHTTASQHPPWNSTPHFARALSAKAIPRIYSPWKASSPLPRRRSALKWRQRLSRLGMHTWGLVRSEPCSPWHQNENVPSTLE